jgi:hypothetical protein
MKLFCCIGGLVVGLSLAFSFSTQAANLYVWTNSPSPGVPFNDWTNAAHTIQDAVDAAASNDTVWVTNGVYNTGGRTAGGQALTNRVAITNAVTVRSVNGPADTLIVGKGPAGAAAVRGVYLSAGASLIGFTVTNGCTLSNGSTTDGSGGGVWAVSSANSVVSNCVLRNNSTPTYGGACYSGYIVDSELRGNAAAGGQGGGALKSYLLRCLVTSNTAAYGGGFVEGTAVRCTFVGNTASGHSGAIMGESYTYLYNCLLTGNSAPNFGAGYGSKLYLYNCTVVGNSASSSAGGLASCTVENSIIWDNTAPSAPNYSGGTITYTATTPLPSGTGNTTNPPGVVSLRSRNYRLTGDSLYLGAGVSRSWMTDSADVRSRDLEGNARVIGAVDLGATEYDATTCTGALMVAIWKSGDPGLNTPYELRAEITGRPLRFTWDFGDGSAPTSGVCNPSHYYTNGGTFTVSLTASNLTQTVSTSVTVTVWSSATAVRYVSPSGSNSYPYNTWADAATNIQTAIDAAVDGLSVVWVTNGTYGTGGRTAGGQALANRVVIDKAITVRSVNGPSNTTIVGKGPAGAAAVRGVYLASGASLIGFTVTNGNTLATGGQYTDTAGGGVWCYDNTSILVSNCVLVGNGSGWGAAGAYKGRLFNCLIAGNNCSDVSGGALLGVLVNCVVSNNTSGGVSDSTLTNCIVTRNSGVWGGGIRNSTAVNCLIVGNQISTGSGGGAGSTTATKYRLENCTVVGNNAPNSGGGGVDSACILTNCIVWGNSAPATSNWVAGSVFGYSLTEPLPAGTGNKNVDPKFVQMGVGYGVSHVPGNYRIRGDSPALDAGTNLAWTLTAVDLDNTLRLKNRTVDMGAYECVPPLRGTVIVIR